MVLPLFSYFLFYFIFFISHFLFSVSCLRASNVWFLFSCKTTLNRHAAGWSVGLSPSTSVQNFNEIILVQVFSRLAIRKVSREFGTTLTQNVMRERIRKMPQPYQRHFFSCCFPFVNVNRCDDGGEKEILVHFMIWWGKGRETVHNLSHLRLCNSTCHRFSPCCVAYHKHWDSVVTHKVETSGIASIDKQPTAHLLGWFYYYFFLCGSTCQYTFFLFSLLLFCVALFQHLTLIALRAGVTFITQGIFRRQSFMCFFFLNSCIHFSFSSSTFFLVKLKLSQLGLWCWLLIFGLENEQKLKDHKWIKLKLSGSGCRKY